MRRSAAELSGGAAWPWECWWRGWRDAGAWDTWARAGRSEGGALVELAVERRVRQSAQGRALGVRRESAAPPRQDHDSGEFKLREWAAAAEQAAPSRVSGRSGGCAARPPSDLGSSRRRLWRRSRRGRRTRRSLGQPLEQVPRSSSMMRRIRALNFGSRRRRSTASASACLTVSFRLTPSARASASVSAASSSSRRTVRFFVIAP